VRKRKRLESRSLFINEDLVEIMEIPARGKRRSVWELSTYEKERKCGAAEQVIGYSRQNQRMSPMEYKNEESREEGRSNSRPLAGSVGRATHGTAEGWSEARECSVLAEEDKRGEGEGRGESVNAGTIGTLTFQGRAGCSRVLVEESPGQASSARARSGPSRDGACAITARITFLTREDGEVMVARKATPQETADFREAKNGQMQKRRKKGWSKKQARNSSKMYLRMNWRIWGKMSFPNV